MPSGSRLSVAQRDPFEPTQYWPTASQSTSRPNYDLQPGYSKSEESQKYSGSINSFTTTSSDMTQVFNNVTANNIHSHSSAYSAIPNATYANSSPINLERNESFVTSLGEMSLDDRISESLNLRSKNTNSENIYSNSGIYADCSTSADPTTNDKYKDIPIYNNFEINPAQQQFLLETKDYYTKLSTPTGVKTRNDYEKNIYVPKYEESEKLQDFSECMENSKNYSALKYQNVDYSNYASYGNYGTNEASISRGEVMYDEVNDTASNVYSEIGDTSEGVYSNSRQLNTRLYDEVYEESVPRPHRPAPPCPSKPK
jgi:hypothetical protein